MLDFVFDPSCAFGTLDSTLDVHFDVRWGGVDGPILGSSGSVLVPHATLGSTGVHWTKTPIGLQDFLEVAAQNDESHHVRCPSVVIPGINDGFCPGQPRAFSCRAEALRVEVRQGGVTRFEASLGQSVLWGPALPGAYALPPGPAPRAPPTPMYQDDAGVIVSQGVGAFRVEARGLHSRCDATARTTGAGTFVDVYGQAGVAEVTVSFGLNRVFLEAGDFKEQVFRAPAGTTARWACNSATAGVNPPPYNPKLCDLGVPSVPPTLAVAAGETAGPTLASGEWLYSGRNHHATVAVGGFEVHVYVGSVRLGVVAGASPAAAATQCLTCP